MGTCVCLLSACLALMYVVVQVSVRLFCFNLSFLVLTSPPLRRLYVHALVPYFTYVNVYPTTRCVRVTSGDLVAEAARGGLLTPSHGRGASSSPAYGKQTS